jgi:hypothetical protein
MKIQIAAILVVAAATTASAQTSITVPIAADVESALRSELADLNFGIAESNVANPGSPQQRLVTFADYARTEAEAFFQAKANRLASAEADAIAELARTVGAVERQAMRDAANAGR